MTNEHIFRDLSSRRPFLEAHVHSVTRALGFYTALNDLTKEPIAVTARTGAGSLRNICLSSMLISGAALFSKSVRDDDVSFEYFHRHFTDQIFAAYCKSRCRQFRDTDPDRDKIELDVEAAIRSVVSGYDGCMAQYDALKPTRDKAIAHISMEDYKRTTVSSVLDLASASSSIYRDIEFVLTGHDVDTVTLQIGAELEVRAITRIKAGRLRQAAVDGVSSIAANGVKG